MKSDDVRQVIFGTFDGLTTAVGVVFAAAITSANVVAVILGLAIAAAVSMAAGEWLSDDETDGANTRRAVVMGLSTLGASIVPALPFFVTRGIPAGLVAAALALGLACVIAELRPGDRVSSYVKTIGVLTLACGLAIGAALLGQFITG